MAEQNTTVINSLKAKVEISSNINSDTGNTSHSFSGYSTVSDLNYCVVSHNVTVSNDGVGGRVSCCGAGSNAVAESANGAGGNTPGSSIGTRIKGKQACQCNGTGARAKITTSKYTGKDSMKKQSEIENQLLRSSKYDTETGIFDNIVQRSHSASEVTAGQTIYGTESELLKLCEDFEDNIVQKGVILSNYAKQINVSQNKNIYESGTDYIVQSNEIQKGYFGIVYVCIDKINRCNGIFVIKEIDLNKFKTDKEMVKALKSLKREIEALINCRHKNIVRLIGLIKEQGHIKILLEHGGDPLMSKISNTAIDPQKLLKWFKGLLSGILCMHKQGFVHCDLHIGNLLIDATDELKICDLGSAKMVDEHLFTVSHGYTACYFPPTVLKHYLAGKSNVINVQPRIDLYATGKLLLEIVSGRGGSPIPVNNLKQVIYSKEKWDSFLEDQFPEKCSQVIKHLITHLMGYTSKNGFPNADLALEYIRTRQNLQRKIYDDGNVELPSVSLACFPVGRGPSQEEPMDTT